MSGPDPVRDESAGGNAPADDKPAGDAPADDDIVIGRIGPARGVRGEVFVQPWTDFAEERFAVGATLRTVPAHAGPLTVAAASMAGAKLVLRFEGFDDRADVARLRGVQLVVSAADRPALDDPDEFYDSDLVGLTARTVAGVDLGPVVDVVHAGAATYLLVRVENQDRLVPFVAAIVPDVDLPGRSVTIDPPEGLFEL